MRRIASHLALLPTGIVDRPLLTLDGRRIVSIGRYGDGELDRMEGIEFYAGILIPGMVDAHCHLELSYLRGAIAPGGGFVIASCDALYGDLLHVFRFVFL